MSDESEEFFVAFARIPEWEKFLKNLGATTKKMGRTSNGHQCFLSENDTCLFFGLLSTRMGTPRFPCPKKRTLVLDGPPPRFMLTEEGARMVFHSFFSLMNKAKPPHPATEDNIYLAQLRAVFSASDICEARRILDQ